MNTLRVSNFIAAWVLVFFVVASFLNPQRSSIQRGWNLYRTAYYLVTMFFACFMLIGVQSFVHNARIIGVHEPSVGFAVYYPILLCLGSLFLSFLMHRQQRNRIEAEPQQGGGSNNQHTGYNPL